MRAVFVWALLAGCGGEPAAPTDAGADAAAQRLLELRIVGDGTVVRDDTGQRCRGSCALAAPSGDLSLTAAPDDGWLLDGWTGRCASHDPHITVAVDGVVSCELHFVEMVDAGTD